MPIDVRRATVELLQGLYGVARTRPIFFQLIDDKRWLPGDGQGEHLHPVVKGGERAVRFVRWSRGGNEPNLIELGLLARLFRQDQVAQVDRVKSAAKHADPHRCSPLAVE